MKCSETKNYYISIIFGGKTPTKESWRPSVNLIMTFIKEGESFNKIAKEIRKGVIEHNFPNLQNKPSIFWWAIYEKKIAENHEYFFDGQEYYSIVNWSDGAIVNDEICVE